MSKLDELIEELCPAGVQYKKLNEIAHYAKKRIDITEIDKNTYVGVENLLQNKQGKTVASSVPNSGKVIRFEIGDILIGNIRPYLRKIWLSDCIGGTNGDVLAIQINDRTEITPEFLYYVISSEKFFLYDVQNSRGAKMPRGDKDVVMKYKLPVPPLEVQCEIVHILDSFTLLTAELTAELTARKKQYEFYRNKLLTFGNDTLECRLKDICDIFLGLTATPNYTDAGVKFISAQNTSNDFLDLSNVKYISETDFERATSNAKPQRGDLLFTRVGSNLGHPVIVETDEKLCIFVSLGYLRVRNKKQVVIGYLKHWMNTDLFWSQVRKNVHGAAKVNLNTGWLKEFRISLPPLETQERIVHVLDNFEAICTDLNIGLPAEIEARQKQYEYYRDLLLTFAETGSTLMTDRQTDRQTDRAECN